MADLGHLRSFLAIYRAGSLTRAARLVHLTQPALCRAGQPPGSSGAVVR